MMAYEIGRYYRIPHVRARWPGASRRKAWWIPVLGPLHEDREIIGFMDVHWHVDYRFLPTAVRKRLRDLKVHPAWDVFDTPVTKVVPVGWSEHHGRKVGYLPEGQPPETYMRDRRVKCKADYPADPFAEVASWFADLEAAYADRSLKAGLICPHRGADLSTFTPDEEGCVTCPLHGLRWHIETGKLVRRAKPADERREGLKAARHEEWKD